MFETEKGYEYYKKANNQLIIKKDGKICARKFICTGSVDELETLENLEISAQDLLEKLNEGIKNNTLNGFVPYFKEGNFLLNITF